MWSRFTACTQPGLLSVRCSTPGAGGVCGGQSLCAVLLAVSLSLLALNCPPLQGTVPGVQREPSGSPFRAAAVQHLPGCLRGGLLSGAELPACLLLLPHGVFSTVLAPREDLSRERAGGQLQEPGAKGGRAEPTRLLTT